jgi:hypothetical protein
MSSLTSTMPGASDPTTDRSRVVEVEAVGPSVDVPAASRPPTSMKFNPEGARRQERLPNRRKKISMPGIMKTPLGPSLM